MSNASSPPRRTVAPPGHRWRRAALGTVTAALAAAPLAAAPASASPTDGGSLPAHVIVMERNGAAAGIAEAVRRLGGTVETQLPFIHAAAVVIPADAVPALRAVPGVRSVTPDRTLTPTGTSPEAPAAGVDLTTVRAAIDAQGADGGSGVDVALVDSGITAVPGLAETNVVIGPDFSDDAGDPELADRDAFGHGTHLAGIIAGRDGGTGFAGIAPDARLVSVKVAARDGSTSLSQLLAGLDWTVRNRDRGGLHIRVLNLAFGAEVTGSYRRDPLAAAVERAWEKGITVVTAAGNGGAESDSLDSPAYDPYVIAVGADDTQGTSDPADDAVAEFSSRGTAERGVDVVAPGVSIVGLRLPDGLLDQEFPQARVGDEGFRGSGTSQAAAVVTGAVARLLAARPGLDPDQVKAILRGTARPLAGADAARQGRGLIDVATALDMPADRARQSWPKAAPQGGRALALAIELAVGDPDSSRWSSSRWSSSRWSSSRWSSSRWSSSRWSSISWGDTTP